MKESRVSVPPIADRQVNVSHEFIFRNDRCNENFVTKQELWGCKINEISFGTLTASNFTIIDCLGYFVLWVQPPNGRINCRKFNFHNQLKLFKASKKLSHLDHRPKPLN